MLQVSKWDTNNGQNIKIWLMYMMYMMIVYDMIIMYMIVNHVEFVYIDNVNAMLRVFKGHNE